MKVRVHESWNKVLPVSAAVLCAALMAASCGNGSGSAGKSDAGERCEGEVCREVLECGLSECGDGKCRTDCGEGGETCPEDCCGPEFCGDGVCDEACGEAVPGAGFCLVDCCVCGDGTCAFDLCGEAWNGELKTCATDCAECGNGSCDPGEGPKLCATDCCGACGDGKCKGGECGEGPDACEEDCGKFACGNGSCDPGENPVDCVQDCEPYAKGNGTCEPGEDPESCPEDCAASCGNCLCEGAESYDTCPVDCGYCGDGYCIGKCPYIAETAATCVVDCCLPYCEGKECGADGCGGDCGECLPWYSCLDGQCVCPPDCAGKECGPDGCGGWCGHCPGGWDCVNGSCSEECQDECKFGEGTCFGSAAAYCGQYDDDPCLDWSMPFGCPAGTGCDEGVCTCHPDCAGKKCGPDGCGGECGHCLENEFCLTDGTCMCVVECVQTCCPEGQVCTAEGSCCVPQCEGKQCGPDNCGGACGDCTGGLCVEGECEKGVGCATSTVPTCGECGCQECVCDLDPFCCYEEWDHYCGLLCASACEAGCDLIDSCGDGDCQPEHKENCGTCPDDCKCSQDTYCQGQECLYNFCLDGVTVLGCCQGDRVIKCITGGIWANDCSLEGMKCGWVTVPGGPPGYFCGNEDVVDLSGDPGGEYPLECPNCVASCVGKECGDDGCGGSCGTCPGALECFNGHCDDVCLSSCEDKDCGDDGCGQSCGFCPVDRHCSDSGHCECNEGECDGACCQGGQVCYEDACCMPQCAGKECGDDGCGSDCGECWGFCVQGSCQTGLGCASGTQPGCGGPDKCPCETCVCDIDPACCLSQWDQHCASICAYDCEEGCTGPGTCGNGLCEPGYMENCGTCPEDCDCSGGGYLCHGQDCIMDFCGAGTADAVGCCAGGKDGILIKCIGGGQHIEHCGQQGQVCGWSDGNADQAKGYHCGDASVLQEKDPSGAYSLYCSGCVNNCTGKTCGDNGCGGSCGECAAPLACFNGTCL